MKINALSQFNLLLLVFLLAVALPMDMQGQRRRSKETPAPAPQTEKQSGYDESLYQSIQWRAIGPFRGGRSAAVTGVPGKPNLY